MDLEDLSQYLETPTLTLPIRGTSYTVESADGERWLRLQAIAANTDTKSGESMMDLYRLALGDTFDQLVNAKVSGADIQHAGTTAFYWQIGREDLAQAFWRSGGKAPGPRRATPKTTRPAAASTTRRRASGSGTSGRKKP